MILPRATVVGIAGQSRRPDVTIDFTIDFIDLPTPATLRSRVGAYILVAGRSEVEAGTVAPNERGVDEKRDAIAVDAFIAEALDRIARKV